MAKVKNLDKVKKIVEDFFKKDIASAKVLLEIGDFCRDRIKGFTRTGFSLADNKKTKLAGLSESYKAQRRGEVIFRSGLRKAYFKGSSKYKVLRWPGRDERLNEVDVNFFSPERSNLTFTGQMIDAIEHKVNVRDRSVVIEVEDSPRTGKYETLTNKEVAQHVAANGRPFLGLDNVGVDRVKKIILASIRKELIKSRLKKR